MKSTRWRAFLIILPLLWSCEKSHRHETPDENTPSRDRSVVELTAAGVENGQIQTALLQPGAFSPRLVVAATLVADPQQLARVGARVAGRLAAIRVTVGQRVVEGQPLIEVDAVELHQVTTEYLTAAARAKEANDTLTRQKQLVAERVGALQELRRAEANADAANATFTEAEEHLHFLGLNDDVIAGIRHGTSHGAQRSVIRAPISGRIAAVNASLGQVLAGVEDLVTIVKSEKIWAVMQIYERDLPKVIPGTEVNLEVPGYPGRTFSGIVSALGEIIDPVSRTSDARADIPNTDWLLKPGMTATAALTLRTDVAAIWLPSEAVQLHGTDRVIFIKTGENRFEAKVVQLGEEQGGFVTIKTSIPEGTQVVVHGAFALRGELERADIEGD